MGLLSATDMMRLSIEVYGADPHTADAMLDAQFSIQQVMTTGDRDDLSRSRPGLWV